MLSDDVQMMEPNLTPLDKDEDVGKRKKAFLNCEIWNIESKSGISSLNKSILELAACSESAEN